MQFTCANYYFILNKLFVNGKQALLKTKLNLSWWPDEVFLGSVCLYHCVKKWQRHFHFLFHSVKCTLREKCPNTKVFLVRIFPYSDWILRFTEIFIILCKSPYSVWIQENTNQKKLRIWTIFTQCTFYGIKMEMGMTLSLFQWSTSR